MTNKEYNGWYNYETWAVALWLDNEQGSQDYWLEVAEDYRKRRIDNAKYAMAECLKQAHEEALPEVSGFAADLLGAAMSEVNWDEIAKHYIEMAAEQSKA